MTKQEQLKKIAKLERELFKLKEDIKIPLSFSDLKMEKLRTKVKIIEVFENRFKEWFENNLKLSTETREFLKKLLEKEKNLLRSYNEEELKANFLIPILNKIDFRDDKSGFRAFYECKLNFENENISLNGTADFIVGRGFKYLETPIFFIQEFKKGIEYSNPEPQLLAEMIAGLEISKLKKIRGAYIVGTLWNFVILEKVNDEYRYSISDEFNSKRIDELENIYKNLLFVKNEIMEKIV